MAEMWKPQSVEVYESWVNAIIDEASELLTNWETDFINSIANQLPYKNLSEKQADILERIYANRTK